MTKTGSGRLNLTDPNTIGTTTVANGVLAVNGALTSNVTVQNGGTLGGTSNIIGNVTIQGGGASFPGNSIGSQTYIGNLLFNTGGLFEVEVNPTQHSSLTVTQTATLTGGIVNVTVDPGQYNSAINATILTAGTLGATRFASLVTTPGFLGTLEYTNTTVSLFLVQRFFPEDVECASNNTSLLRYLNNLLYNDFDYVFLLGNLLGEDCNEISDALNYMSSSSNTAASFGATINVLDVNQTISAHMFDSRFSQSRRGFDVKERVRQRDEMQALAAQNSDLPPTWKVEMAKEDEFHHCAWGTGFANFLHEKATPDLSAFNLTARGFFAGYDVLISEYGFLGTGAGYADSSVYLWNDTNSTIQSAVAAAYGTWTRWDLFIEGSLLFGYNRISNQRHIFFIDYDALATSSHDDWQLSPHLGLGYDIQFEWGCLEPYALFDYVFSWETPYREFHADLVNTDQKSRTSSLLRSEVGLAAYQDWDTDVGMIALNESVAFVNRTPIQKGQITANFVGTSGSFTATAFNRTENLFAPSLEVYFKTSGNFYTTATYEGEFGSSSHSNQIRVTFGKFF